MRGVEGVEDGPCVEILGGAGAFAFALDDDMVGRMQAKPRLRHWQSRRKR